jgi:lysophospholipase L1-like esterase
VEGRKEAFRGVVLAAATLLGALLVVEAGLAIAGYPPAYTDHQQLFVEYDSVRGWRNVPDAHRRYVTPEFSVAMDYNAHAYRGPLVDYAKPAGTYRVLLLGDSYLEGYTVPLEDRVAEVAQRMLASGRRPGVEIIALGTGGYSTDQELLWLESEGARYAPDLVVVLFCVNDVWYNNLATYPRGAKPVFQLAGDSLVLTGVPVPRSLATVAPQPHRSVKAWLVGHSHLVRLVQRALHRSPLLQAQTGQVADEFLPFEDPPSAAADSSIRMTAQLLARMNREAGARGAKLVVMLIPEPRLPLATARFAQICKGAKVECVDPTARFSAATEKLVFPEDGHWNANGHRLAASVLAEIVQGH